MQKKKVSAEKKLEAVVACIEGRMSQAEAARKLNVNESRIRWWIEQYKVQGALAFSTQEHNKVYPEELKLEAVREYLKGVGSLKEIAAKYGLRAEKQLQNWIKVYNSGKDFGRKQRTFSTGNSMQTGPTRNG